MRQIDSLQIRELIADLDLELNRLRLLEQQMQRVQQEIADDLERADLFYESLALKLHNFYTGCERIFRLVAIELNGGVPSSSDWHWRLLDRMTTERDGRRAVVSPETALALQEFLGFRHVVRSLYGYELDTARIAKLMQSYPAVWLRFAADVRSFAAWLQDLADSLDEAGE